MLGSLRRFIAPVAAVALIAVPSPAIATTGGTSVPPTPPASPNGGVPASVDAVPVKDRLPRPPKRRAQMPTLTSFALGATRFTDDGKGLPIAFTMTGTTGVVHVRLGVYSRGRLAASFDLGRRSPGRTERYLLGASSARKLPSGSLVLRLSGRDARGHHLRAGLQASAAHVVKVSPPPAPPASSGSHAFPLLGTGWSFGGAGSRFGAPRTGHIHQGQDIAAPSGTPIVAPAAGTVTFVAYQARGAGYYVVMHEAGQPYWYAFMHLLAGSTAVQVGQSVSRGQLIGNVGATGDAQGPHLHFEIWQGPWQAGGHPIDPLPYLQQWASGS